MYLGKFSIGDVLTFPVTVHGATGGASDADAAPDYSIFKGETTPATATGTMAKFNATTGFYMESVTLSGANGFASGNEYVVYVSVVIGGITVALAYTFQIG